MKDEFFTPRRLAVATCSALVMSAGAAQAQSGPSRNTSQRLDRLQQQLSEQAKKIEQLEGQAADQDARYNDLLQRTVAQEKRSAPRPEDPASGSATAVADGDKTRPVRVGQAPLTEGQMPTVAPLFEQPGILTPKGHFVFEPSFQYGYSSSNRVALVGYTVIPALLIGLIDVREVKRNTFTAAVSGRWGVSNRIELEAKVPYVSRSDSAISREIFTGSASEKTFDSRGKGIGDVELAGRYQFTDGTNGWPYLIGSLRFKTRTGKDPFEVVTDCVTRCVGNATGTGLPLDLPTGSGFYSLQPSLTWLFPSDPAVFFGGVSYTRNFGRNNVSRLVRDGQQEFIGSVKPGDAFGVNFGMGLSLNDRSSFSIGVDLSSIGKTKQNGKAVPTSVRTQLASLLLGYSYRYSDKTTFNLTAGAGLTRDTPDLTLTLRIPFSY